MASGVVRRLFWKHLFPAFEKGDSSRSTTNDHRPLLFSTARGMLIEVLFALVGEDRRQVHSLIHDLDDLVPFDYDEEGMLARPLLYERLADC